MEPDRENTPHFITSDIHFERKQPPAGFLPAVAI